MNSPIVLVLIFILSIISLVILLTVVSKLQCKHSWVRTVDKRIPSVAEEARNLGLSGGNSLDLVTKHMVLLTCTKCGKIKKFIESNKG